MVESKIVPSLLAQVHTGKKYYHVVKSQDKSLMAEALIIKRPIISKNKDEEPVLYEPGDAGALRQKQALVWLKNILPGWCRF